MISQTTNRRRVTHEALRRFGVKLAQGQHLSEAPGDLVPGQAVCSLGSSIGDAVQPFGDVDAWNVRIRIIDAQGQEVGKNIGVWISTDARRLPLRIEGDLPVGTFTLSLREVQ